jgi:hypothetical protein
VNDRADHIGLLDRVLAYQWATRVWRPHITPFDLSFLLYVIDNTVGRGRTTFYATTEQLIEGHEGILVPTGLQRTSLVKSIKTLKDVGALKTRSDGRNTYFSVDLTAEPEELMAGLKLPKRLREPSVESMARLENEIEASISEASACRHTTSSLSPDDNQLVATRHAITKGRIRKVGIENPSAARGDVQGVLSSIEARKTERRTTNPDSWTCWSDAWSSTFPSSPCPVWAVRDKSAMKQAKLRCEGSKVIWPDFVTWSVTRWTQIMSAEFGWMKQSPPPAFPNVLFFARFITKFLDRYLDEQRTERRSTAITDEEIVAGLIERGMTRDEALVEIGKRKGVAAIRTEVAKAKSDIAMAHRVAARVAEPAGLPKVTQVRERAPEYVPTPHDNPYDRDDVVIPTFDGMKWED